MIKESYKCEILMNDSKIYLIKRIPIITNFWLRYITLKSHIRIFVKRLFGRIHKLPAYRNRVLDFSLKKLNRSVAGVSEKQ